MTDEERATWARQGFEIAVWNVRERARFEGRTLTWDQIMAEAKALRDEDLRKITARLAERGQKDKR